MARGWFAPPKGTHTKKLSLNAKGKDLKATLQKKVHKTWEERETAHMEKYLSGSLPKEWSISENDTKDYGIGKEIEVGWRVEQGYKHDRRTTAYDVIAYEQEDLGNDNKIPKSLHKHLKKRPATDLIWVTLNAPNAKEYGDEPLRIKLPKGSRVIGNDMCGGYLVLKGGII